MLHITSSPNAHGIPSLCVMHKLHILIRVRNLKQYIRTGFRSMYTLVTELIHVRSFRIHHLASYRLFFRCIFFMQRYTNWLDKLTRTEGEQRKKNSRFNNKSVMIFIFLNQPISCNLHTCMRIFQKSYALFGQNFQNLKRGSVSWDQLFSVHFFISNMGKIVPLPNKNSVFFLNDKNRFYRGVKNIGILGNRQKEFLPC